MSNNFVDTAWANRNKGITLSLFAEHISVLMPWYQFQAYKTHKLSSISTKRGQLLQLIEMSSSEDDIVMVYQ